MKRKRRSHSERQATKKVKTEPTGSQDRPTWPLLRYYYPEVTTLRRYLAAKLSKTSKKRSRALLHYGQPASSNDAAQDVALTHLLDSTVVGSFTTTEGLDLDAIERDLTVYTQQVSDSTTAISATQGVLKQSEVGLVFAARESNCHAFSVR